MKTLLLVVCFCSILTSCGDNNKNTNKASAEKKAEPSPSEHPDYAKGLALVAQSDCFTCHELNEKKIGPSYLDVAARYVASDAVIDTLAHTIIKGSTGKWGQVPMTPHPTVSIDDARAMVKYIMTFKK